MADYTIVEEALKRGYTMDEIADNLARDNGVDPADARGRGYTTGEMMKNLGYVKPETSDVARGFVTSFKQLPQLGYGLLAGAGAVAESVAGEGGVSTSMKNFGVKKYQEAGADIEKDSKQSDSLSYSWEQAKQGDFGSLVDWLQYGIGYGGGQAVQALATAGVGSLVGKTVLKGTAENLASKMVAKEALRLGATEEAKRLTAQEISKIAVANVASNIGQTVAIGSQAFGMEGGEIFGDLAQKTVKEGRAATGGELAKAFGATAAAGALEFVGDKLGVDVMLGKSKMFKPASSMTGVGGRAARAAVAVPGTVLAEGGTEYLQTGIEEYGKGNEKNFLPFMQSESAQKQALDAAGLGAVGGGGMAMVGGAFSSPQKKDAAPSPSPSISSAQTADDAIAAFQDEVARVTPRGSFGNMDELAGFIEAERSDIGKRRGLLAQQQQDARDMENEFNGLVKDEQIDQSYRLNDAQKQRDAERTRDGSYDLALQQREEQQGRTVEQLSAASEAQGFGEQEPTAMQLAMQRAQQKALDNEFSGLLKQERASLNEMRANVKRVAGVPVEQISTPQLAEIAQSDAHPNTKMAAVAALNDRHDAIQQERERLMQLREARLAEQSQGETNGVQPHAANGQVAARGPVGGSNHVPGGGLDAAVGNVAGSGRINANPTHVAQGSRESVSVPNADSQANVRALTENAAKRQATQLTNQGYPTVAYPHPTQAGMWAIGSQDEAKAATVPATSATQNDAPPRQSASWVIRNKETGEVVMETFDRKKVDALNTAKYEAVPIREYLEGLNNRNESTAAEPPAVEVRAPVRRKRPASNNIAQAIINLGGISTSLKQDITGDASVRSRPGLFTKNGTADLGELAARLSGEFGFTQIDVNDPEDNSGAKQLADLIASSVDGETILNEEAMIRAQQDEEFEQAKAEVNLQAQEIGIKPIRGKRTIDIVQSEINAILAEREEMSRQKQEAQRLLDEVAEQELIDAFNLQMQEYHDENAITRDERREESARLSAEESAQGDGDSVDQASPVAGRASPTEGGRGEAEVTPEFGLVGQTEAEARAEQGRLNQPEGLTKDQIDREATAPFSLHSDVMPPSEGPSGETSSMFTPDGRATKAAGDKPAEAVERPAREFIGTGDKLYSESGRALSPAPKIETGSVRKTNASIKRMNAWLLDEARKEAEANGNDWQQTLLRGIDANKMQQPDRDTVNDILFGDPDGPQAKHRAPHDGSVETPKAAQSILKPLSEPTPLHPDRTSTIAAVRRGDLTPEDVAEAHPVEQEVKPETVPLSSVIDKVNSKYGEGLTEEDRVPTPYTIAEHSETIDKLNAGTLTVEEYKAAFARAIESREALAAEFQKMTKDAIMKTARLSVHYKNDTKDRIVKAAANETVKAFDIRESSTWVMGTDRFASLRNFVEGVTQADLDAYAAKRKAKIEEYVAGRQAMREGIDNPQTLEDFRNAIQVHKSDGKTFAEARMMLTPEQRATFDELTAEESRKTRNYRADQKAVVQVAAATTEGQIVQTKHTKTGEDLFVVKAAERVERDVYNQWNATAKKLGGWYSSFRGAGAVPGFQFKTMENAEAFLKYLGGDVSEAKAAVQERRDAFADDKSQSAVERLREMAERLDEKADEALGRDRKANTARRARFAAAAESAANGDKAMAATMRNIAQAIESGSAKFLDRVRQKTQIEMLNSLVSTALWDYWRAKYPTYSEQERHKGEPAVPEVADYARFPQYTAFRSDLAKLGRQMLEIDGAKKIGQQLLSVADDVTDAYLEFAKANLHKVSTFKRGDGQMAAFSSRDAAEKAIARSGYKGKAIVLPFKRGQNIIVQSPSFAKENGIWEGDGDKLITLNAEVGSAIVAKGKELGRKLDVPSSFGYVAEKQSRLRAMGIETPAEFRAMLREFIGMKQAPKAPDRVKELERAMAGKRNTDGLDFFPTPAGTVRAMLDAAEIEPGMSVLEPSAGMGHIADMIREEGVEPDVVEISGERRELLDAKGHNVVGSDFMEVAGEYDRILMNPPFGDRRDAEHVRHAFDLLASNGRLVAIMGEGVFFGQDKKAQQFREWLESVGGTSEKLDEGTFLDPSLPVNTGVNARLVVIDKRSSDVAMFSRGRGESETGSTINTIAAAIRKTYGDVLDKLQAKNLITLTQTQDEAIEAAAKARAEKTGRPLAEVRNELLARVRNARGDGGIDIVDARTIDIKRSADGSIQGFYDPQSGQSFLIADGLTNDAAPGVLAHEVGIHMAADKAASKNMERLFKRAGVLVRGHAGAFFDRVRSRMKDAGETSNEEAAAYIAEEWENNRKGAPESVASYVREWIAAVKAWLAGKGVSVDLLKLGPADIAAIARANVRQMAQGAEARAGNGTVRRSSASPTESEVRGLMAQYEQASSAQQNPSGAKAMPEQETLDSLNPTGSVFSDYSPERIAALPLGENITTLDKTSGESPDTVITIYRGTTSNQGEIVPGDFVTTSRQLAKDYAGTGKVISKQVRMADVLDDITEPLGEEYIYRPASRNEGKAKFSRKNGGGNNSLGLAGGENTPAWDVPPPSRTDNIIYTMQDKNIDLKRVQQAIKEAVGEIRDDIDTYLQEELFHGRAAKITEEFLDKEVNPLISLMRASNVSMDELETFLWARHAKERNAQIAKINDEMPDGGSGLTNKQADDLMGGKDVTIGDKTIAGVKPARKKLLSDLAGRVDVITKGSRALLERYGLESAETLNAWDGAYQHYVPLHREDTDSHLAGMGTGQGYSVKGSSSKRATGSFRPVENILANLVLQRERIITRGEKNRVAQALHGLAKEMPNADLWEVDVKPTIRTTAMIGGREQVVDAVDPNFRNKPNVVFARFNGEDHFIVFNERNERALRMAEALKNLDADDISHLLGEVSRWTRYFASINTQYNPIFGVTNLVRDVQTGLLNLKSTPIEGKQKEMMGHLVQALPAVFKALRADRKGQAATGTWAQLWEEFQEVGGQTGYRDMFRNSHERAEALQNALDPTWWQKTWWGKAATVGGIFAAPEQVFVEKVGKPFMELLSDYNTMMENGIRLSAYKLALDSGMTKERAASLAKNLTVNFNRKGQAGRQVGAMYAFFNASVQGTARMAETLNHGAKPGELLGKAGKQIIYGGLMLGALQAMLLLAAGFDDEEPPEFVRDRNIIIPTGNGKYISIPLPLGFHVLPAISRISIEFTAGGFKKPGEHLVHIMDVLLDSFNPIGNAGLSMQTVAPTVLDPIAALTENKDWSGRQIARQDFSKLNPTPGHTRAKDTASSLSRGLAYALNYLSGGGEYGIGVVSPTPDQIDYLLGQLTGGVGRELGKVLTTAEVLTTGEDLPPHKIPLVGRFYGDTTGQSSEASKFYGTLEKLSEHKGALDRMKDAHDVEAYREYAKEHPEIRLYARAARVQREMASLRKLKRKMIERNADRAKVRQIEDRMRTLMTRFNQSVSEQKVVQE